MNKVILIGRLGKDPVVNKVKDTAVCTVSMATSEKYKTSTGETKESTDWHTLVFWGRNAEVIHQYCIKGTHLAIEGKVKTRSYDNKDGQKVYVTEVFVDKFEFLGGLKPKDQAQTQHASREVNNFQPAEELSDLPF